MSDNKQEKSLVDKLAELNTSDDARAAELRKLKDAQLAQQIKSVLDVK